MGNGGTGGDGPQATVVQHRDLRLHLFRPAPALSPYITVYYRTEVPGSSVIEDWLPPELSNLRVGRGGTYEAAIGDEALRTPPLALLSGPTSRVTRLRLARHDAWGVGLLPLGFSKLIGMPASRFANRFEDLSLEPSLAPLNALLLEVFADSENMDANVALLDEAFSVMLAKPLASAAAIVRTHRAIVTDATQSATVLAELAGMNKRTFERFCLRHFGFQPRMLLRRQRFLRSLGKFMVDPTMKWVESLDTHYHDQAHFVREFRWFMRMLPSEYAALEHPIAMTAARARRAALGEAMQILHRPHEALLPL